VRAGGLVVRVPVS